MSRFSSLLIGGAALLCAASVSAESPIVISEIMYHPSDKAEALEFLELHNPEAFGFWQIGET